MLLFQWWVAAVPPHERIRGVTPSPCKPRFQERTQLVVYSFLAHIRQLHRALSSRRSRSFLLFLMVYRTLEENKYAGRKGRGL